MALHKHVVSGVTKRLSTFASLTLNTLAPVFIFVALKQKSAGYCEFLSSGISTLRFVQRFAAKEQFFFTTLKGIPYVFSETVRLDFLTEIVIAPLVYQKISKPIFFQQKNGITTTFFCTETKR